MVGETCRTEAIIEAFKLLQGYARNHTPACVVPALFIAGGIITFLSQASVMRYPGPRPNKSAVYSVASVAGVAVAVAGAMWGLLLGYILTPQGGDVQRRCHHAVCPPVYPPDPDDDCATIIGLTARVFEMAVALERMSRLGIVATTGLAVGTFLTMIGIPVVYSSLDMLATVAGHALRFVFVPTIEAPQ